MGDGSQTLVRRLLAVAAMFLGAAVGALLVLTASPAWALAPELAILALVAGASALRVRYLG